MSNCFILFDLRNSDTDLVLPMPNTEFRKRIFRYNGTTFRWSNLPVNVKKANTLIYFKKLIKERDNL
jgi:hypothetical protein